MVKVIFLLFIANVCYSQQIESELLMDTLDYNVLDRCDGTIIINKSKMNDSVLRVFNCEKKSEYFIVLNVDSVYVIYKMWRGSYFRTSHVVNIYVEFPSVDYYVSIINRRIEEVVLQNERGTYSFEPCKILYRALSQLGVPRDSKIDKVLLCKEKINRRQSVNSSQELISFFKTISVEELVEVDRGGNYEEKVKAKIKKILVDCKPFLK